MRKKILKNYIIILLISALLTGALAFYFINYLYIDIKNEDISTNISLIESNLNNTYSDNSKVNFFELSKKLSKETNNRVTFLDLNGVPIADSINNSIIFKNEKDNEEFILAKKGINKIISSYSEETGLKYLYLSKAPLKVGDKKIMLRLGDSNNKLYETLKVFFYYFLIANALSILIAIIISIITSNKIVKPINELISASKDISKGNFKNKIKENSKNEIGELALTFNEMAKELEKNIFRIKQQNIQMNSVLSNIQDGILALDLDKKIFLVSNSINEILENSVNIKKGQYVKEVLKDIDEINHIEEKVDFREDYYGEVKIKRLNKIISISIYPIILDENELDQFGTIIMLRDITEMNKLENMRKNFVSNVSHEIRTPLTSIAGFVETLKTKKINEKNKNKALDIIELETLKLKNMINELLQLSEIANIKETEIAKYSDIGNLINESLIMLDPMIKEKKIKLSLNIDKNLNTVHLYEELFKLVFTNIVENSIKYNKLNGTIGINVYNFKRNIKLTVEDNGIGISDEDMPLIFERFYRAKNEDTFNRKGTGIGLSIVEDIMSYMNGDIKVTSKLGEGTKFEIIFFKE